MLSRQSIVSHRNGHQMARRFEDTLTTTKLGGLFKILARCLIILTLVVALINYSELVMV